MQPLCTVEDQCLFFFPGIGFRPAIHVVQRDQYGDRLTLVVGDDSPLEGKLSSQHEILALPVDPYGFLEDAPGPVVAALVPPAPGGPMPGPQVPGFWGGSSGSSDPGRPGTWVPTDPPGRPKPGGPWIEDTSSVPPDSGHGVVPPGPDRPTVPGTEVPPSPELPPLTPVPLPDAAPLLIASLLALSLLRRLRA